jgi:cytoskeletal protein CcmA (bactofilin family)
MVFSRKPDPKSADIEPLPLRSVDTPAPPVSPAPRVEWGSSPSESVIGRDLTIEGQSITIRCQGSLLVNGTIHANVQSMQLTVGEEAVISGAVKAETVEVYGKVQGSILASRVVLHESAEVEGDIHSQFLSIEEGASFDGRSRKVHDPQEIAPPLTARPSNGTATHMHEPIHEVEQPIQLS